MTVVLERVVFNGSLITMRHLTFRMAQLRRERPWMTIGVDLKWRRADYKVAILGTPRFVLPIPGVA